MGMAKYADVTPFYECLDLLEKKSNEPYKGYLTTMLSEMRDKLDDLPEAVLCKDCEYYSILGTCRAEGGLKKPTDYSFCSYGERKLESEVQRVRS